MRIFVAHVAAAFSLCLQAADFSGLPARQMPKWVQDGIIYEINPSTFSPAGNFAGITARLDDLQKLGVNILWLMPVHPVGQLNKKGTYGSPYSVRDYYAVNPAYGTLDDLKTLIREAHRRDLRVIIDIVANHTAWDSVMMEHPEFYRHNAEGKIISPIPDWADVAGLDYTNAGLREYMITMLEHWLRDFDLDGFRCDAAGMVPTSFWEQARPRLQAARKDLFLLAEWNSPDLEVNAFDLDYAWPFHKTLTEVLEEGAPAAKIRATLENEKARFPRGAEHMMFSDNHDEKRAIARFGERGALAASALVFAVEGVPMIYNGMEVGDTTESGGPALFEKLPVFWPIAERRPDFPATYAKLISLRKQHESLRSGEMVWADSSDPSCVLAFTRKTNAEELLFVVNLSNRPFEGSISGVAADGFVDLEKKSPVTLSKIQLDAWGWRWYIRKPQSH
jgi:glycosidase